MKQPRVFVTRKLPDALLAPLAEVCDVTMHHSEDLAIEREELLSHVRGVDGILTMLTEKMDEAVLEVAGPQLKVISNMAVGVDNIDLNAAHKRNITVCNTPDVLTESTADLTFALLLATARRLVQSSQTLRAGLWREWSPFSFAGQDVYGKTLGIIGMGRIGEAVARRARGFGMNVLYFSRSRKETLEATLEMTYCTLQELLSQADFISILTPLTDATHKLIGKHELSVMKPSAILINTARGAVIDELALIEALTAQKIAAVGLDVYSHEPIPSDHPLLRFDNVTLLPHIGSATYETRTRMAELAVDNLVRGIRGEIPRYTV